MSRSRRGQRNLGDEYWSRRPLNGYGPSSENKHITHGIERARARQEIMAYYRLDSPPDRGLWLRSPHWEYIQPDGADSAFTVRIVQEVDGFEPSPMRTLHYTLMLHGY